MKRALVVHHIAVDGVSWQILLEDLRSACEQLRCGQEVRLPAKDDTATLTSDQVTDALNDRDPSPGVYVRLAVALILQCLPTSSINLVAHLHRLHHV